MATIADNVRSMAALVAEVKRAHHLSEPTVLRIIDMNFALAQGMGAPALSGDEELPFDTSPEEEEANLADAQVAMFPLTPEDDEEVLATVEPTPLEN